MIASLVWAQSNEADRTYKQALELHRSGDLEGAVREYRAVLDSDPNRVDARSNLGAVLAKLGRYEEAIGEYQQALNAAPPQAAGHLRFNLALAYYKSFQIPRAAEELSKLHAQQPDDINATLLLADCDLRMGEFQQLIALLTPIEPLQPDNRAIAYMLGMALIRDGQVSQGQQRVDRILRDGETAEGQFLMGAAMFMAKDYPGAAKSFARAVALNPNVPSLQSYYGQALLLTGDPDGAAQAFRIELAANRNDYDANYRLAEILAERRAMEEALPLFERAVQVRPGSAEARLALAKAYLATQSVDKGRAALELATKQWPEYADAHAALADTYARLGRERDSQREKALAKRLRANVSTPASDGIANGRPAPEFDLPRQGSSERIALSQFRGRKPVVLVFGSYTCPNFRSAAPALNSLFEKYGEQVAFLLVYIREAHSTAQWQSTINERQGVSMELAHDMAEKTDHASVCLRKLNIKFPAVVDGMDGKVEAAYQAWPSRVYVAGRDSKVRFSSGLSEQEFHAGELKAAIERALE